LHLLGLKHPAITVSEIGVRHTCISWKLSETYAR
jgi:hypothetical protein